MKRVTIALLGIMVVVSLAGCADKTEVKADINVEKTTEVVSEETTTEETSTIEETTIEATSIEESEVAQAPVVESSQEETPWYPKYPGSCWGNDE